MADYPHGLLDLRIFLFMCVFLILYALDSFAIYASSEPDLLEALELIISKPWVRKVLLLDLTQNLARGLLSFSLVKWIVVDLLLHSKVRRIIVWIPYFFATALIIIRCIRTSTPPGTPGTPYFFRDSGRKTYTAGSAIKMRLTGDTIRGFADHYPTAHPADSSQNSILQRFQRPTSIGRSALSMSISAYPEQNQDSPARPDVPDRPSAPSGLRISVSPVPADTSEDDSELSCEGEDNMPQTPKPSRESFKHLVSTLNTMFRSVLAPEYHSPGGADSEGDREELQEDHKTLNEGVDEQRSQTQITSRNLKQAVQNAYPGKEIDVSQLSRAVRQALPNIEYCRQLKVLYQHQKIEADELYERTENQRMFIKEMSKQNKTLKDELIAARRRVVELNGETNHVSSNEPRRDANESDIHPLHRRDSIENSSGEVPLTAENGLEQSLKTANGKIKNLRDLVRKQGTKIHDLMVANHIIESGNRVLSQDVNRLRGERNDLRLARQNLVFEINNMKEDNKDMKEKLQALAPSFGTRQTGLEMQIEAPNETRTTTSDANNMLPVGRGPVQDDQHIQAQNTKLTEDDRATAKMASQRVASNTSPIEASWQAELERCRNHGRELQIMLDACRKEGQARQEELKVSQAIITQLLQDMTTLTTAEDSLANASTDRGNSVVIPPQTAQYNENLASVVLPRLDLLTRRHEAQLTRFNDTGKEMTSLREENRTLQQTIIIHEDNIAMLEAEITKLMAALEENPHSANAAEIEIARLKIQYQRLERAYKNYRDSVDTIIQDNKNYKQEISQLNRDQSAPSFHAAVVPRGRTVYVYVDPESGEKLRTTAPNSEEAKAFKRNIHESLMVGHFLREQYVELLETHNEMHAEWHDIYSLYLRLKMRHFVQLDKYQELVLRYNKLLNLVRRRLVPIMNTYKKYYEEGVADDVSQARLLQEQRI